MSSISLVALALAAAVPSHSPRACPSVVEGVRLTDGTVYDGPIASNAILMGDWERKVRGATVVGWRVDYIYKAGRQVHLSCAYAKNPPVIVRIAKPVTNCRWTSKGANKTLACR